MKVGELIPLSGTRFLTQMTVPAGKESVANLGVLNISFAPKKPTGPTSKTAKSSRK